MTQHRPDVRLQRRWLAVVVGLIWAMCLRWDALDRFPPFIDETVHIHTGELMWANASPLEGVALGRQFTIWGYALLRPFDSSPIWIARAVNVLLSCISAACALSIARRMADAGAVTAAGIWAGAFAGLLYLLSSYHYFFDRLALADPFAGAFVMAAAACALRLRQRVRLQDAVLTGVCLFLAAGAKINVLPYFGIPIAAALTLHPHGRRWAANARWSAVALGVGGGLLGAFALTVRLRGLDFLGNSLSLALSARSTVSDALIASPARVLGNIGATVSMFAEYWSVPVVALLAIALLLLIAAALYAPAGRAWMRGNGGAARYLVLTLLAPPLIWWINVPQESRFFVVPGLLLLTVGAILLGEVVRRSGAGVIVLIGLLLWGGTSIAPFIEAAANDPQYLPLAARDQAQYIASDASGFGFDGVYAALRERDVSRLIGVVANCHGLRYRRPRDLAVTVECPQARPDGQDVAAITALMAGARVPGTFVVLEPSPYLPARAPGTPILTVDTPQGRPPLTLYDLTP